mgnify:CR=1 FL=1
MASNNNAEASSGGMPQLDFSTFPNQVFWLSVTIFCLLLMVRFIIIPRMDNILANRRKVIEEDLVGAEKFREAAEELEKSITQEMDQSKARANEMLAKSKEKIKQNRQKGLIEAEEMTRTLLSDSEKVIVTMQREANKKIEKISAELAPEIIKKLSPER